MADTTTTNLGLTKPEVGASADTWGGKINTNLDLVDGLFAAAGNGTSVGLNVGTGKTLAVGGTLTMSALTASTALALNASKQAVSVTNTGTGNNVLSASPTLTGTIDAAAQTLSGNLTLNGGTANGVLYLDGSKVATSGTALVFDGTNLGIGTSSPGYKLDVVGATRVAETAAQNGYEVAPGSTNILTSYNRTTNTWLTLRQRALSHEFYCDGTERLRLDSSGNLGLGVTPSAWSIRALQVGSGFAAWSTAVTNARIFANTYYDGAYKYVGTGRATQYEQDGYHAWYTSASGTAGNTISWTQAMTLSAAGDLGVGTTSPGARLDVGYTAGNVALRVSRDSSNRLDFYQGAGVSYIDSSPAGGVLAFATVGTERARITSDGYSKFSNDGTYFGSTSAYHEMRQTAADTCVVLNATNASFASDVIFARTTRAANSAYNFFTGNANGTDQVRLRGDGVIYAQNTSVQSISDARLKENIRNATEGLNVITALRPVRYDWKSGYGNNRKDQLGFIAQEIEAVFPEAVSEWQISNSDQEAYKTVGPGALIPVLVKAIQEQQAMIKSLEAKVAALESK